MQKQQQLTCSHRQKTFLKSPQLPHSGLCDTAALLCSRQYKLQVLPSSDTEAAQKCGLPVWQLTLKREQEVCGEKHPPGCQEKGLCSFILLTPKKNCNYPKRQDVCNLFVFLYSSLTCYLELPFSPQPAPM